MFYQIFLSLKVKRCVIIFYKHGIYELSHELPNDLRLRKLGNSRKVSKLHRMTAKCQSYCQIEILLMVAKKSPKIAIKLFP